MRKTKRRECIIRIPTIANYIIVIIREATRELKQNKNDGQKRTDLRKSAILQLRIHTIKIGASCTKKKWCEMELILLVVMNKTS